jgi:hypothetical protein
VLININVSEKLACSVSHQIPGDSQNALRIAPLGTTGHTDLSSVAKFSRNVCMSSCGEVLVVIMNNQADWKIAQHQHWYRIPSAQAEKLKKRKLWHPQWLAFYQTKEFAAEGCAIRYFAEVTSTQEVFRYELFPDETQNTKSKNLYQKINFLPVQKLSQPIASNQFKRITFIPTTWQQLSQAQEIKDL